MVYRDDHKECTRCHGRGVVKIKAGKDTIEVLCSCPVGRMVASHVPSRIEMWARERQHG